MRRLFPVIIAYFIISYMNVNGFLSKKIESIFQTGLCHGNEIGISWIYEVCADRSLSVIPTRNLNFMKKYEKYQFSINLSMRRIKRIDDNRFYRLNISVLELSSNKITEISNNAFKNVVSLRELSLKNNLLTKINTTVFKPLYDSLKSIDISNNLMQIFPCFSSFKSLNRINLAKNYLTKLENDKNTLQVLPQSVETLDLEHNRLSIIKTGWFKNLTRLQYINLAHNHISLIENDTFFNLFSLQFINLNYNYIKSISNDWFKMSSFSMTVQLLDQHVEIEEINNNAFDIGENSVILLGNNRIKTIKNKAFCQMSHFKYFINLNNVTFKNINPCMLKELKFYENYRKRIYKQQLYIENIAELACDCETVQYFQLFKIDIQLNCKNLTFKIETCKRNQTSLGRDLCRYYKKFRCSNISTTELGITGNLIKILFLNFINFLINF